MKRILNLLLLVLLITCCVATAEAKTKPRKSKKTPVIEAEAPNPAKRGPHIKPEKKSSDKDDKPAVSKPGPTPFGPPVERQLTKASSRRFDVRSLPKTKPEARDRQELEPPPNTPVEIGTAGLG